MTNDVFSRRLLRMDKQLRRVEERLAPPKLSEAARRWIKRFEDGRKYAEKYRVIHGLEPMPKRIPYIEPEWLKLRSPLERTVARLNVKRDRLAAEKKKRDAEAQKLAACGEGPTGEVHELDLATPSLGSTDK
jgi:hypothetical protein